MKKFNVYVYFPASELEITVQADSMQEAAQKAELNGHKLLAKGVVWNDSTEKKVRVIGILEQGDLSEI